MGEGEWTGESLTIEALRGERSTGGNAARAQDLDEAEIRAEQDEGRERQEFIFSTLTGGGAMALETKVFTSYTTAEMLGANDSDSGDEPTDEGAVYIDPLTGEEHRAETGKKLAEMLTERAKETKEKFPNDPSKHFRITDLAVLQEKMEAPGSGWTGSEIRKTGNAEWFEGQINMKVFQDPNDPEKMSRAHQTIVWALANPKYLGRENKGKNSGGVQSVPIDGRRALLAWGVHRDQNVDPHFMFFANIRAIKPTETGFHVSQPANWLKGDFLGQETDWINECLAKAGFAEHERITRIKKFAATGSSDDEREVAKKIAAAQEQALRTGEAFQMPEPEAPVNQTGAEAISAFRDIAKAKREEANRKWLEAKAATADAMAADAAAAAIDRADRLTIELNAERAAKEAEAAARATAEGKVAEQAGEIEEQSAEIGRLSGALMATSTELAEVKTELEQAAIDYETLEEEKTAVEAEAKVLRATVLSRDNDIQQLKNELSIANQQIEQAETLAKQNAERAEKETKERMKAEAKAELEAEARRGLEQKLEKAIEERDGFERELGTTKLDRDAEAGRADGEKKRADEAEIRESKLRESIDGFRRAAEAAERKLENQTRDLAALQKAFDEKSADFDRQAKELRDKQNEFTKLQKEMLKHLERFEAFTRRSQGPGNKGGGNGPGGSGPRG